MATVKISKQEQNLNAAFSSKQLTALATICTLAADHQEQEATWLDMYLGQVKIIFPNAASYTWARHKVARAQIRPTAGEYAWQRFCAAEKTLPFADGKLPTAGTTKPKAEGEEGEEGEEGAVVPTSSGKGMNAQRWAKAMAGKIADIVEYAARAPKSDVNATTLSLLTDALESLADASNSLLASVNE